MGAFALCIENATRDIHSLLTLHRVHPQVHADIQRILGSLLRKQYTDMTVHHSPELADAPEQVCRALVEHIVDKTVNTAIPAANLASLEKRCMRLEEEKGMLDAEATKMEGQLAEVQTVLRNLKDAHDYMLHSYFREVLTLRSRIDDLQRQNRAYRAQATAASAVASAAPSASIAGSAIFSTSMGSQLQQFVLNNSISNNNANPNNSSAATASPSRDGAAAKRLGADEVLLQEAAAGASEGSAPSSSPTKEIGREGKANRADGFSRESSPTHDLNSTRRGPGTSRESLSATTPGGASSTATRNAAASPRGKDRSVRIASGFASSTPRGQNVTMQTTTATTYEVLPPAEPESVDAIFDYEEYVRILNGERGSWAKRFVAVMSEPDGGARRRRRSVRVRARTFSDVLVRGGDPFQESETFFNPFDSQQQQPQHQQQDEDEQQQHQQAKTKGFRWLLHLALEPIQHKFHAELNHLRQAVLTMQKEHARDVQAIARALTQVQSRNDALLDFLETFVQDTKRTIAVLSRDSRAHTITDLLSSGTLPVEKTDNVSTFFTPSATPSLGFGSPRASPSPPPPLTQLAEIVGDDNAAAAMEASMGRSASAHALHPRKEWRLKPDARLTAEKRTAAMRAMDRRLKRPDVSKAAAITAVPPEADTADSYYRADLGLPYWSAHPITTHAKEVFGELQLAAKEMRVTRLQQLYAFEEAVAARVDGVAGGRRVRFEKPQRDGSAAGTASNTSNNNNTSGTGRRHRSSASAASSPIEKVPDTFYGLDVESSQFGSSGGNGSLGGSARPRKRLQEGWRNKTVVEGDGATAADLLQELIHLRMRRACDQIRLARVQDTILRTFYPDQVDQNAMPAMWTKRGKQSVGPGSSSGGAGGGTAAAEVRLKPAEMPPLNFTHPEEVLKHRALQRLRTDTQKRIGTTSQRIAELQRLLAIHFAENEVQEVVDYASMEAAQQRADEEAAGMYRVNGELKSTEQLWNSPYLNDGNRSGRRGVLYLPIGLTSTVDAEGNVSGGAGAVVMLGDTPISVAPFAASANTMTSTNKTTSRRHTTAATEQAEGGEEAFATGGAAGSAHFEGSHDATEREMNNVEGEEGDAATADSSVAPRNTPFAAVMDYCRGVQLGRPMGRRGGPVYLLQDPSTGEYYVGDAEGRPAALLNAEGTEKNDDTGTKDNTVGETDGRRPPLAMTRILFPAPLPGTSSSSTTDPASPVNAHLLSESVEGTGAVAALPAHTATTPTNTTASLVTFGGPSVPQKHAASSATSTAASQALQPLYLVPMAVPLSDAEAVVREGWQASHRHGHTRQDPIFYTTLAPLPLSSSYHHVVPQRSDEAGVVGGSSSGTTSTAPASTNIRRYLVDPPRVFQPVDEAASMVRVRGLRLQSRNATEGMPCAETHGEGGASQAEDPLHTLVSQDAVLPSSMVREAAAENAAGPGKGSPHSAPASRHPPPPIGPSALWSGSTYNGVTASPAESTFTNPIATNTTANPTPPASVPQPSAVLATHGGQPPPRLPLDPLPSPPCESAAPAGAPTPDTASFAASTPPPPLPLCRGDHDVELTATAPQPSISFSPTPASGPASTSMTTAAVLLAKQQRAARLAREAEAAQQRKTQRLEVRPGSQKDVFRRLPHLSPLPTPGAEANFSALKPSSSLLPSAANSARLQRQMRSEKYALSPPPPSSRRAESSKPSSSEWNLKDD